MVITMTQRYFVLFILKFNINKFESLVNAVNMINFQDQVAFNYFFEDWEMNVKKIKQLSVNIKMFRNDY